VLKEAKLLTRDMGGTATTRELGEAVAEVVREV
jgi:isocitrate/isopropylmalate dehydrogenase